MYPLDPRLPGVVILASSAAFVILKRWTTGSFLKGKPERGFSLWFSHVFNLFFLTAMTPAVAILMVARKWEILDPTVIDLGQRPLHLLLETSGILLSLGGNALMGWALVTMRGHFQVLGKLPRPTDRLLFSGPYRLVRHPMYASLLGQALGLALLTQSLAIFALFCVYLKLIPGLIAFEEEGLRQSYGEKFASYQSRVKKLVPLFY
jgi:protein-S-isoprenylcysteine O-methyltransferase Ste14